MTSMLPEGVCYICTYLVVPVQLCVRSSDVFSCVFRDDGVCCVHLPRISICEIVIVSARYAACNGALVSIPHMGPFPCNTFLLLKVLRNTAYDGVAPYATYRMGLKWVLIHTFDTTHMDEPPYGTHCPFGEFWRITLKIRLQSGLRSRTLRGS